MRATSLSLALLLCAALAACGPIDRQTMTNAGAQAAVLALNAARMAAELDRLERARVQATQAVDGFLLRADLTDEESKRVTAAVEQIEAYRLYLRRQLGQDPGAKEVILAVGPLCRAYAPLPPAYLAAREVVEAHKTALQADAAYLLADWDYSAERAHAAMQSLCRSDDIAGVDVDTVLMVIDLGVGIHGVLR